MHVTEVRIPQEGIAALRGILGERVSEVYSPDLCVQLDNVFKAASLSLSLSGRPFLNARCEWDESRSGLDFWRLEFQRASKPLGIVFDVKRKAFKHRVSQVELTRGVITKIEIYEASDEFIEGDERAVWDQAVVFFVDGKAGFIIASDQTIAGDLVLARTPVGIEDLKDECRLRLVLSPDDK